jgi:1,4-alpha-glucan branching enzyme
MMTVGGKDASIGTFCLVLHTHLPWLVHHGSWPVGEEWLYQAWAEAYLPVVRLLRGLADEGRTNVVTLGVTPVLAAQLDDVYGLREMHTWLGSWQVRAVQLGTQRDRIKRAHARYEHQRAEQAMADFEQHWSRGGSSALRPLVDAGVVELLGGPATHPFQPLLPERLVDFGLQVGLDDAVARVGRRPSGIWAPECGYRPGLATHYASAGVSHFVVDGPTLQATRRSTAAGVWVEDADVAAFARDLEVTYRVWSPRSGYPGGRWYRDFHTFDHWSGFRASRVTSRRTPPEGKAPYDPQRAAHSVAKDAVDFVAAVVRRLSEHAERDGRNGLVVAAYDTELFGHWWHEGPQFLAAVLRQLPEAGVRVTTLQGALDSGLVRDRVDLPIGSWGSGKDWRVWDGPAVAELTAMHHQVAMRLLELVDKRDPVAALARDEVADQLTRDTLLALASDWTFMVAKDSAAQYAGERALRHATDVDALATEMERGRVDAAARLAAQQRRVDGPFGHLDVRLLAGR